jgi:predicted TPR repeat methyltransferase
MLERAQARGLYDDLRDNEAVADMLAHPGENDLAVAADAK